jgi:hypothetical protein
MASLIYVVYVMLIELNASVAVVASNLHNDTRRARICTARACAQEQEKRKTRVSFAVCDSGLQNDRDCSVGRSVGDRPSAATPHAVMVA